MAQPMQGTSGMQFFRQQTLEIGPGGSAVHRVFSTNASPAPSLWQITHSAGSRAANRSAALWRRGAGLDPWRVIALLMLLSFVTAWSGARVVMAGFEDSWTELALTAARYENQELRDRQDILREQTAVAQARLEALETTGASGASAASGTIEARYTRNP